MCPTTTSKIPSHFLTQQNIITTAKEKLSKTHSPKMLNITLKNFSEDSIITILTAALKAIYSHRHKT